MGVVDNVKEVADLVKKLGDIELYRKIVELEEEVLALNRDNRNLSDQVSNLQQKLSFSSKLTHKPPLYYAENDPAPFCPRCWENDQKPIHLVGQNNQYDCPLCLHYYWREAHGWTTGER